MTPLLPPVPSFVDLTAQFAAWEQRGRGWDIAPEPVALEPCFVPFRYRLPETPGTVEDDGHVPGIFERIAGWFTGGRRREDDLPPMPSFPEWPDPEPPWEDGLPCEMRLALPAGTRVARDAMEHLLVSLGACRAPVAFELLGTDESVTAQFACAEVDQELLRNLLATFFPSCVVREGHGLLKRTWRRSGAFGHVVDFGLSEEFMLPLKVWKSYDPDPLMAAVGALAGLGPGETAALQVLFQPARCAWAESILNAVLLADDSSFFCDAPELARRAREKIRTPLYGVGVRAAARAGSRERAWMILRGLAGALAQFAEPGGNEFLPLNEEGYKDGEHEEDLLERRTRRTGMLLNTEELLALVHPPSASVLSPKLARELERTKTAPPLCVPDGLVLGQNVHAGERRTVGLTTAQRTRHQAVLGASGSGKSTYLLNMITQDLQTPGQGLAVLDPHGDLIDQILARVPEERFADVILVDPADEEYPVGFNILQGHSELEKTLLASDLIAVFRRLSTSWGDRMNSLLSNAIAAFLESTRGGTLNDLRRFLVDPGYREEFLETVTDPELVYYWRREFPLLKGADSLGPILTRLDTFLRPKLVRRMVGQKKSRLDFAGIMNGGKIFLARLSQGAIGEENAYLLGSLLISKFHQLAIARQELRAEERRPFWLYVDECHNFITPSMASILQGTRKYGLGLVLVSQELRQWQRDPEVASAILANAYTRVCFRVGDADARALADGFSYFESKDLQNLGIGQAIARVERAEYDFNLTVPQLAAVDPELSVTRTQQIRELSREQYAARREEVDRALLAELEARNLVEPKAGKRKPGPPPLPGSLEGVAPPNTEVIVHPPTPKPPVVELLSPPEPPSLPPPLPLASEVPLSAESVLPKLAMKIDVKPPSLPSGRGGREHKYLQQLIKQWAEGMGWRATIEKTVEVEGKGSVDVALEKAGRPSIACEISVTTAPAWEFGNVLKCLEAGFQFVIVVSGVPKKLDKLRTTAESFCGGTLPAGVRFFTPEELFAFVQELERQAAAPEPTTVRGYRVKVQIKPGADSDAALRKRAVSKVLTDSMRRANDSRK